MININQSDDPFYRYKMPNISVKYEGSGNGKKTILENLDKICKSVNRPVNYVVKYLGYELGTNSSIKKGRIIVNGFITLLELQTHIFNFINDFVICPKCENPETIFSKSSKGLLKVKCNSCGTSSKCRSSHKIVDFILKNENKMKRDKNQITLKDKKSVKSY